jgi:RND family efflux transporter MFP subunit
MRTRVLILGLLLLAAACRHETAPPAAEATGPVTVTVQLARVETLVDAITASGTVVPAPGADWAIVAPEPARIVKIGKIQGQTVVAGEELVRFDVPALTEGITTRQAAFDEASSRLARAKAEVEKANALLAQGLLPRNEAEAKQSAYTDAQSAVIQTRADLETMRAQLQKTVVKARFDGLVAQQFHVEGDVVTANPQDPVMRVIDPKQVQVVVALSAAEIGRVSVGQTASIGPRGLPGEPGTVVTRPLMPDPTARTIDVRVAFLGPTLLPLETPVEVVIVLDQRSDALAVPRAAVVRDDTGTYVLIAGADDRAHRKVVQVGLMTSDRAQILSGLSVGDRVIVTGIDLLSDGAPIAIAGS